MVALHLDILWKGWPFSHEMRYISWEPFRDLIDFRQMNCPKIHAAILTGGDLTVTT